MWISEIRAAHPQRSLSITDGSIGHEPHVAFAEDTSKGDSDDVCSVAETPQEEVIPVSSDVCPFLDDVRLELIETELDEFIATLDSPPNSATSIFMLSVVIEEVLPRPESGLLKRMLRMTDVPVGVLEGTNDPIIHLRASSECHFSVGLAPIQDALSDLKVTGPVEIRVRPVDGDWTALEVNCEQADDGECIATAFWNLTSHGSKLLASNPSRSPSCTSLAPVEFQFGEFSRVLLSQVVLALS